jgi:Zn finger protein HypA/HybF involved in hydrogenase expression
MHELAIAESVLEIACRHAAGRRVTKIELRVGHLRQVVPSSDTERMIWVGDLPDANRHSNR